MVTSPDLWVPRSKALAVGNPADVVASSVETTPTDVNPIGSNFMLWVAQQADGFTPWGTNPKERDRQLRSFLPSENALVSAVSIVAARNAALSWKLTGEDKTIEAAQAMLNNANYGGGWEQFQIQVSFDLYGQDNGAFVELIRDGASETAPVVGLAHLDSARCYQTGNAEFPVVFQDINGRMHNMPWYSVVHMLEIPAPIVPAFGGPIYRLQYCLHGDSSVRMADGRVKRIRDVVRERDPGPVMSLMPDGTMGASRITDWHVNGRDGREWINVRGQYASVGRGNHKRNSWVTADHPMLTPDGWVHAGGIHTGDPIVTEYPAPNLRQYSLIAGTILGDASLPRANTRPRLSFAHKAEHEEWASIKADALAGFGAKLSHRMVAGTAMASVETVAQPAFVAIREAFYSKTEKLVPRDLIAGLMSPELLAAWYLDDGHLTKKPAATIRKRTRPALARADIGCSAKTWSDAEWLAEQLSARGYEASVLRQGGASDGPRIHFSGVGTAALMRDIGRFIPPALRYKATDDAPEFAPQARDLGAPVRFIDRAVIERGGNHGELAFCIDVEDTQNFVTAGLITHNCAVTRALRAAQVARSIAIYKDEKVSGRFLRALHLVSGVGEDRIRDAIIRASNTADAQGLTAYQQPAIVGGTDPNKAIGHETIELASMPEGWDEENSMRVYILALSMALLTDYQEFAPLPGGGLGTARQSETLHMKSRGKGSGLYQKLMLRLMNGHGVLPANVQFEYDEPDLDAMGVNAGLSDTRATTRATRIASGEIDPEAARQIAFEDGDLDEGVFQDLVAREAQRATDVAAATPKIDSIAGDGTDSPTSNVLDHIQSEEADAQQSPARGRGLQSVKGVDGDFDPEDWGMLKAVDGGVPFGHVLSSRLHRAYSDVSDDAHAMGYFSDTDQRVEVASAIGPALKILEDALKEAGIFDIMVAPEDVNRIAAASMQLIGERAISDAPQPLDRSRLEYEAEVGVEIAKGLEEARRIVRRRLVAAED